MFERKDAEHPGSVKTPNSAVGAMSSERASLTVVSPRVAGTAVREGSSGRDILLRWEI